MLYILALILPPVAAAMGAPPGKEGSSLVINLVCCLLGCWLGGIVHAMVVIGEGNAARHYGRW